MPNKPTPWNEIANQGNPTRSTAINQLIHDVKKKEVHNQGARRLLTTVKYRRMQSILKADDEDQLWKYGIPVMNSFQFHLIGRIDDTTQLLVENLKGHPQFTFCLTACLSWSKNGRKKRVHDAPWQVVIGAMDVAYCVLISTMVRAGFTANVAVDRIYAVYGANSTVTNIINRLRTDKTNGNVHPSLTS